MGGGKGGSKSQTIGYKYKVGMHLIACHGPADYLIRLTVDERVAWTGQSTGGSINVNAPELFGGDDREGGVSGLIDVEMGGPTQTKNSYLLSKIGPNIPAYRGVVGLVFHQVYMGNNPYLKAWRMRLMRIHKGADGVTQWYDATAQIPEASGAPTVAFTESFAGGLAGYTAFDPPGSTGGGSLSDFNTTADVYGTALEVEAGTLGTHPAIRKPLSTAAPLQECHFKVKLMTSGADDCGSINFRDSNLDLVFSFNIRRDSAVDANRRPSVNFRDKNNDPGTPIGPNGGVAAGTWYQVDVTYNAALSRFTITMTNLTSLAVYGSATVTVGGRSSISYVSFENDNFHGAGESRWDDVSVLVSPLSGNMNPAHITREALTNPDWGMGYNEDDIDDDAFTAAANQLYAEGLGMSLLWDKQMTLESFIAEIIRHIDAALYVSRSTGKFRLKLTRADYDVDDLILLDESNIDKIESPTRPAFGELVNSVTAVFWNSVTGKDDSVTVQDPAGVQMQGAVINTAVQYPGFTSTAIGNRIAARDLRSLSNPFLTCTIYTTEQRAGELDIGDCFKLSWGKWYLSEVVMRVTGFAMSDGKSSQIRINCVEDVFATPVSAVVVPPAEEWVDPAGPPVAAAADTAFEIPYYELVQAGGQTSVDTELDAVPERGFVGAAAMRGGSTTVAARLWTDSGAGYEQVDTMDLCPGGFLDADLGKTATTFTLEDFEDLDLVTEGSHAQIGTGDTMELVRVDTVDAETGEVTVGRGVLDTVPGEHADGTIVLFWDNYGGFDGTEYVSGEIIGTKITPTSGQGQVALVDVTEHNVEMASRAIRPYPPGNLLINGLSYDPADVSGDIDIDWAHRDRKAQTGGALDDHTAGDIGPEAGQLYRVQGYIDGALIHTEDDIAGTSTTWTPVDSGLARIEVHSKRDALFSFQAANHEFLYFASIPPPSVTYSHDFSGTPWISTATSPSAMYVASLDKTFVVWESKNDHCTIRIAARDHAAGTWSRPMVLDAHLLVDDNHGMPALEQLSDGRLVCFYGSHGSAQDWSISAAPAGVPDITTWTRQAPPGASLYTYPKPVNHATGGGAGVLHLFLRKSVGGSPANYRYILLKGTYASGGALAWSAEIPIVDFNLAGAAGRVYMAEVRKNAAGTAIEMCAVKADTGDTTRQHVYYFRYIIATGNIENLDASVSTVGQVSAAVADASYRIKTSAGANKVNFVSWCRDGNGYLHIMFGNDTNTPFDMKHDWHNGVAWQGETLVGQTNYKGGQGYVNDFCLVPSGNDVWAYYPKNDNGAWAIYGGDDMARKFWTAGAWGGEEIVLSGDEVTALGFPTAVKNADPDLRVMFTETVQTALSTDSKQLKRYFLGDSGFLEWPAPSDPYAFMANLIANFEGANNQTTYVDESCFKPRHTMTFFGNAKLDTGTAPPWGTSWLRLDGNGDYVTVSQSRAALPDGGDWKVGSDSVEIVFRLNELGRTQYLVATRPSGTSAGFALVQNATNQLQLVVWGAAGATVVNITGATVMALGTTYKAAFKRTASGWELYLNGTLQGSSGAAAQVGGDIVLYIGRNGNAAVTNDFNGWVKQVRWTKKVSRDLTIVPAALFPTA